MTLQDTLSIPYTLTTSLNDETHLTFEWYVYTDVTFGAPIMLSRKKHLDEIISPQDVPPGIQHTLTLKVTDTLTGVFYTQNLGLMSVSDFTKGTLYLCEEDGVAEINFFSSDSTFRENIFANSNGGKVVGQNPQRIFTMDPSKNFLNAKAILVLCNDENGGRLLNSVTMEEIKTLKSNIWYDFNMPMLNAQLYHLYSIGITTDYVVVNGQVCKRAINMKVPDWDAPMLCLEPDRNKYEVDPLVVNYPGCATAFFDRKYGRILKQLAANKGVLVQQEMTNADITYFDINNLGTDMEMVCSAVFGKAYNWFVLRNRTTKELYLYKYTLPVVEAKERFVSMSKVHITAEMAPHFKDAISVVTNNDFLRNIIIYATKDGVYSFNVDATTVMEYPLTFTPAMENMEITGLRFQTIFGRKELRVLVKDKTLSAKQGGVIFYDMGTVGGINGTEIFRKTGFCDRVIDVAQKNN